ncbi:MAG: hypothetical protein DIU77_002580 [Thermocrispum agreste]|uniref:Uncharacterized protein n=1 Tax=Thermocrispum agreste TaxID=37925 RepID=A0ABD6FBC3_9PSEU
MVVALAALGITGFVAPGFFLSGGSSDGESGQTSSGQSGGSAKEPVGQKRAAEGTIPSEEDEVPEVAKETRGRFLSEISNGNAAAAKANTSTLRWARVIADRVAGMQHYIVLGRAIVNPERIQTNLTGKLGAQDATGLITLRLPDADGEWCVSEFEFG